MRFIVRWLSLAPFRRETQHQHAAKDGGVRAAPSKLSYRAVELRTRGPACAAARELAGKRLLVAEAPPLPLADCNARCMCYYEAHADRRRDEPRRAADLGVSGSFYAGPERRSGLDRRQTHRAAEDSYYDYMRRRT